MKKIILSCQVLGDGLGDFQHLLDIYNFLKKSPTLNDYEFILVVTCEWDTILSALKMRLENLGMNHFFLSTRENFEKKYLQDESLIKYLGEAEQLILVSSDTNILDNEDSPFQKFINPNAARKFIGEHERDSTIGGRPGLSLGLSDSTYGIKLQNITKLNSITAFNIFAENDALFSQHLVSRTNSSNAEDLFSNSILVPAYFNKLLPLYRMLLFLVANEKLKDKNFIINVSGTAGTDFFKQVRALFKEPFLKDANLKEVKIVNQSPDKNLVFAVNPNGGRTIYVFYGYQVSEKSYQAMYQQAKFAGVSGDNTFELAVSTKTLPFYHSKNAFTKKETLVSLIKIISSKIELPETTKNDFLTYFGNMQAWCEILYRYGDEKEALTNLAAKFKKLDLPSMIEAWPIIADYLFCHYNFYDNMVAIITGKSINNNGENFLSDAAASSNQVIQKPFVR